MSKKFYIDQDAGLFVVGPTDSNALPQVSWKNKDQFTLEFYLLRQTGIFGRPFSFEDRSSVTISVGLGLLSGSSPVATAVITLNLPTIVTVAVTTTTAGSSTTSEVQTISFSPKPSGGAWKINVPADSRSITSAVTAGVFITTTNHGFVVNEPVTFSSITGESNFSEGVTYYVFDVSAPDRFRISATIGGAVMTTATASSGSGTVATPARASAMLASYAEPADVQTALRAIDTIGSTGVEVKGVSGDYFYISATGNRVNSDFPELTVTNNLLPPYGKSGSFSLSVSGLQTLLDAELDDAAELILETEVNDTGSIRETYSTSIKVIEDIL